MIGQLQKNYIKLTCGLFLSTVFSMPSITHAQDKSGEQITSPKAVSKLFKKETVANNTTNQIAGLTDSIKKLQNTNDQQTSEIRKLKSALSDQTKRANDLKTQLDEARNKDDTTNKIAKLNDSIKKLQNTNNQQTSEIRELNSNLTKQTKRANDLATQLEKTKGEDDTTKQITELNDSISDLQEVVKKQEENIRDLESELTKEENRANSTFTLLKQRDETIATLNDNPTASKTLKLLEDQRNEITKLNAEIDKLREPSEGPSIIAILGGGLASLLLGGLAGFMLGQKRPKRHHKLPIPPILQQPKDRKKSQGFDSLKKGMAFAASPMMLGGLPPALAAIKPVYDAVGRIGFAQDGKPVGKDESFGTGILISENHVLTNRHVWEMFKDRLASDEPTGIEFYGEKETDKTDFVSFADIEPVCIEGWDAAIFTLSRSPDNRKPVTITPRPAEQLNDLDIVVVGYPQAHRLTEDIAEVTEKNPIFGVKRYSEGKIFRHSADIENPYGVEAAVESIINPSETMRAICHNASTLGGSSGSAVICKKTGELIALHFGFDSAYEWEEAANFAVAGENLAEEVNKITNAVTAITDKSIA